MKKSNYVVLATHVINGYDGSLQSDRLPIPYHANKEISQILSSKSMKIRIRAVWNRFVCAF